MTTTTISTSTAPPQNAPPGYKALTLDLALYEQYLDSPDLTNDQRREFLEALWTIIVCFVDLGVEIRPEESCGQLLGTETLRALAEEAVVNCRQAQTTCPFNDSADTNNDQREREES